MWGRGRLQLAHECHEGPSDRRPLPCNLPRPGVSLDVPLVWTGLLLGVGTSGRGSVLRRAKKLGKQSKQNRSLHFSSDDA
jgi:hypothetical protein